MPIIGSHMNPQITVLVPTFNRADFLAECLRSLLNQSLPASHLILVNDGSEDHTLSGIKPYLDKIKYYETDQVGKPSAIKRLAESSGTINLLQNDIFFILKKNQESKIHPT